MLFLENPENRPALWNSLLSQLIQEKMCFLISDGAINSNEKAINIDQNSAKAFIDKLQKLAICRISSNRGKVVSPHIAGTRANNVVTVTELITFPSNHSETKNIDQIKNDLESVVVNLFYAGGDIDSVFIPSNLEPWEMKDAEIRSAKGGLLFKKKNSTLSSQL
jgi:hypothetical protein